MSHEHMWGEKTSALLHWLLITQEIRTQKMLVCVSLCKGGNGGWGWGEVGEPDWVGKQALASSQIRPRNSSSTPLLLYQRRQGYTTVTCNPEVGGSTQEKLISHTLYE